ncbi:kinase-like domain-containing protein [Trametes punicea]|nr:kinase-like domain-containing protein [Trametes punicea]
MVHQIAKGMSFLNHRKVLHGNLKGVNVLVNDEGHCGISEFGQSEMKLEAARISGKPLPQGTLRWKAPELISGNGKLTKETDVYAFAITVVDILTKGDIPWGTLDDAVVRDPSLRPSFGQIDHEVQELRMQCKYGTWPSPAPTPTSRPAVDTVAEQSPPLTSAGSWVTDSSPSLSPAPLSTLGPAVDTVAEQSPPLTSAGKLGVASVSTIRSPSLRSGAALHNVRVPSNATPITACSATFSLQSDFRSRSPASFLSHRSRSASPFRDSSLAGRTSSREAPTPSNGDSTSRGSKIERLPKPRQERRQRTVPQEQAESWARTRERIAESAVNVLGVAGQSVHELLDVSVDILRFGPIVGLEEAARTLLNIWDALQLINRLLACLRLTERCATILA